MNASTLPELILNRVERDADRTALHVFEGSAFRPLTWNEFYQDVLRTAAAFLRSGIEPGDRVAQFSPNRYEWIVVDAALQLAGAVHVPMHAPLSGPQAAYQISHSGSRMLVVAGGEQLDKLGPVRDQLPEQLPIVAFELGERRDGSVRFFPEWCGSGSPTDRERVLEAGPRATTPDSLATVLYTSGTTGEPKGVMLTQTNLVSNSLATVDAIEADSDDVRLNFLPLSHIFARTCDLYTWYAAGSELALARSRETVMADCAAIKPTVVNGVPYFFDRVMRGLREAGMDEQPGTLRHVLGGKIRMCCSGGAPLPDHVFDFFQAQEVPLLQGYGLTESSPVITLSSRQHYRRGSSGRAIPGVEIRIAEDGEILTRGPHVMSGYYRDPEATAAAVLDGWLHTGDLGALDDDGYLFITGRKKEILVTTGGKNIAPTMLEALLTESPLIQQALVVGDGRDYLTALLVPDLGCVRERLGVPADQELMLDDARVRELFESAAAEQLSELSRYEQIQRFRLLPQPFSIESGELTPKLSLRRTVICDRYASEIESMYEGSPATVRTPK